MAGRAPALGSNGNADTPQSSSIFRGLKFYLQWTPDAKMFNDIYRLIHHNGGCVVNDPSHPLVTHLIVHPAAEDRSTKDLVVSVPRPRAQDIAIFNARRLWKADDLVAHFARRAAGYPQTTNISDIANYRSSRGAGPTSSKVVIRKEWVEEAIEARTKFHGGDGYAGWEVKCTIVAPAPTPALADVPPPPSTLPPPPPPPSPPLPPRPSSSTPTPTQSLANRLSKDVIEKRVTPTPVTPAAPTPRSAETEGRPIAATPTSASPRLLGPPLSLAGPSKAPIYPPFPFTRSNTCPTTIAPSPQRPPPSPFGFTRSNTFTTTISSSSQRVPSSQVIADDIPSLDFEWKFASQEQISPRQGEESPRAQSETGSIELGRPTTSAPAIKPSPSASASLVGGVFSSAYPLPMSFHVVDNGPAKSTLELLITAMGGGAIPTNPASANYIILNLEPGHRATLPEHLAALHSVRGDPTRAVLSSAWINSCIKSGRVVPLEPYVVREAGERLERSSNALSLALDLPPTPAPSGTRSLSPDVPLALPRAMAPPAPLVGTSTRSPALLEIRSLSPDVPLTAPGVSAPSAQFVGTGARSPSPDIPLASLKVLKAARSPSKSNMSQRRFRIESEDLEDMDMSNQNHHEQVPKNVGDEVKRSRNNSTTPTNEPVEEADHSCLKQSQSPSAGPTTMVIDTKKFRHYIEVDDSDLDELFLDVEEPSVGPSKGRRHTSPLSSPSPEPKVEEILGPDEEDATSSPERSRSGSGESAPFSEFHSGGTPSAVPGGRSASGKRRRNEIDLEDQEAYELLLDRLRKRSRGVSAKTFFSRLQSEKSKPYWRGLFRRYDRMIRKEVKGLEGWEP